MKKVILFLLVILSNIVMAQQSQNLEWLDFPNATKCEFIGKYRDHYVHVYINKENKLVLRKYQSDLKKWEDQILNIEISKNYFYQKSVFINNQLTHLISQFNPEENKINLWAYVTKNVMDSDFQKVNLMVCDYYFGKSWLYDMSAFCQFNFKFSNDKSKFYVQQKEALNPVIFQEKEKSIYVYDTNDLSKVINGYRYIPQRIYFKDNGINVLNNGSISKMDIYRLEDPKTKKKSNYRFRLKYKGINTKDTKTVYHISEDTTIIGLKFREIDSKLHASGIKFESIKRKNHFINYTYSTDNFTLLDSTTVAYTDEVPIIEKAYAQDIITTFKGENNNLLFITSQNELSKNKSFIDYKNIGVYCFDASLKQVKTITNFPVKLVVQTYRKDQFEAGENDIPLSFNYTENGIEMLYKDFSENENAIKYTDYIKFNNSKNSALVYIKIDAKGNFSKKYLIQETIEKKSIDYKQSKFLENNLIYLVDSKNKKFTVMQL